MITEEVRDCIEHRKVREKTSLIYRLQLLNVIFQRPNRYIKRINWVSATTFSFIHLVRRR